VLHDHAENEGGFTKRKETVRGDELENTLSQASNRLGEECSLVRNREAITSDDMSKGASLREDFHLLKILYLHETEVHDVL